MICEECGKKLGIFEGFQHPTMGNRYALCNPCFDQVSESVAEWKEFVISNSFNLNTKGMNSKIDLKKIIPTFLKKLEEIETVWSKKEYL